MIIRAILKNIFNPAYSFFELFCMAVIVIYLSDFFTILLVSVAVIVINRFIQYLIGGHNDY